MNTKEDFKIGDEVSPRRIITFINGDIHLPGYVYVVTADSLAYFNSFKNEYTKLR